MEGAMPKPQITEIAQVLADRMTTDGVEHGDAVEAWRQAIHYARRNGMIDEIASAVASEDPQDADLEAAAREMTLD